MIQSTEQQTPLYRQYHKSGYSLDAITFAGRFLSQQDGHIAESRSSEGEDSA